MLLYHSLINNLIKPFDTFNILAYLIKYSPFTFHQKYMTIKNVVLNICVIRNVTLY
jgi:hypothetical protein